MKQIVITALLSLTFVISNQAQTPPGIPPTAKPGACYAKSVIETSQITSEKSIAVYIGTDEVAKNDNIELLNIVVGKGSTKWEKKGEKYVLVEEAQKTEQIIAVKDVSLTDEYVMEVFTVLEKNASSGMSEWRQVICEAKLTSKILKAIQTNLRAQSFYNGAIDGMKSEVLAQSLQNFQRQNNLPIGSYNYETMSALSVKIPN